MTFESARTDGEMTDATQTSGDTAADTGAGMPVDPAPGMASGEITEPVTGAVEETAEFPEGLADLAETPKDPADQIVEERSPAEQAGPIEAPSDQTEVPVELPGEPGESTEPVEAPAESPEASVETSPAPADAPAEQSVAMEQPAEPEVEGGEPTLPEATAETGEAVIAEPLSEAAQADAEQAAGSGEVVAPAKPLDLDTISIRTTTLEKDVETAEHKVSLMNRLTALQDALNNLDASEIRAELDARLAAVQSAIAAQAQERITLKEAIIAKAEELRESSEWKATSEAFRTMQEELRNIGAAGKELDDPIWERFRQARADFHERRTAFFAERQKQWEESKAKKETLAAEAEALAEVEDFKDKSSRARAMMDEWKAAGFAGREAEDELWPKFRGALDRFYERRTAYYEQNKVEKERLAAQAEEIADSTDWRTTAEALRRLMAEWKTLGSAGRENDDPLWERFRGAQQKFYDARSAVFAERETAYKENIARKEELCEQAEEIAARSDMRGAIQDVIALQAAWKQVGFIPRDKSDELWHRFKAACDAVFTHVDSERQERQQSREQGFKDAVSRKREQYQRLNESIAHDQANINRWRDTISSLGGGGRADQIRNELENRVIEVLMRVRDKQQRAEELANDLQEMESRAQNS